jgi:hypothetical protein
MIEPCPCKDCPERFAACSGKCPKDERGEFGYKAWKARYRAQQKHLDDTKFRWQAPWTADRERRSRQDIKFGSVHKTGGEQ